MMRNILILCIVCLAIFACDKTTKPNEINTPTFVEGSGIYFQSVTVRINCAVGGVTIRYTLDGTNPTTSSLLYSPNVPLRINRAMVLKARAYKAKWNPSPIGTATYNFNVSALFITPLSSSFTAPQTVTITALSDSVAIYYTTDGSEPNTSSTIYTQPFIIDSNTTVKAKGFRQGWTPSETRTVNYAFSVIQPTFGVLSGTYENELQVSLNTITDGAYIRYTTNGSEPNENSNLYSAPVNIVQSTTLNAKAFKTNCNPSNTVTAVYTLRAKKPTFNPVPGTFYTPQNVAIETATANAVIHYTTNGDTPTANSPVYSSPVSITSITNLKAVAIRNGWSTSNLESGYYNLTTATPTYSMPSGSYNGPQMVEISCQTPDAVIRYTTNNTEPSSTSPLYSVPINITTNTNLKARAFRDGYYQSAVVTANYFITNTVAAPTFDPEPGVFFNPVEVDLSCTTPNAEIRYTLDGTEPTISSTLYFYTIQLAGDTQIKAKAFLLGWTPSETVTGLYQFDTYDQIVAWGVNNYNQTQVPIGTDFIQIDAGMYHTVALRADGSLVAWGRNNNQQCNFPAGNNYVAVSAGDNHSMALKADGSIVAWGLNTDGQCDVPDSLNNTYVAVTAGGSHSLALTDDNKIVAWGKDNFGQGTAPADSNFVMISAGANHNIALRQNGSLLAWGSNDNGQINAPTGTGYTKVAAGDQHCVAQRTNGTLVAWGLNTNGQTTVPTGNNYIQISAGYRHNLALTTTGSIVTWGYSGNGLANVPTVSTYIDISAGRDFSVTLKNNTDTFRKGLSKPKKTIKKLK